VLEQNSDGFSSYVWDQFALHGFFGHQTHGPPGATLGRIAANPCDNALFLPVIEHLGGAGSLLFIKSAA